MIAYLGAIYKFLLGQLYLVPTVLAIFFVVAHVVKRRDRQRPPMVPYLIPWIGSAIEMGKDTDTFFESAISKLGPVFRVRAIGNTITYITSPELISAVYRDAKTFEFTPIRLELTHKAFGMSYAATYSPFMQDHLYPIHRRGLSPTNVAGLLERYTANALEDILRILGQFDGTCTHLTSLLIPPAYTSVARTFFGRSLEVEKTYDPFHKFDDYFPLLAAGLPRFMMPGPHRAWDEINLIFEKFLQIPHEDCSELMLTIEEAARDSGWSDKDIARAMSSDLWAMEANVMWASYWAIALELQQPQGLEPLVAEVDLSRKEWETNHPGEYIGANLHRWLSTAFLPLLTSTVQEALRLYTSVFSMRIVSKPTVFGGYHFEAGERIICATRPVHLDEEIHTKAREFMSDRYMDDTKKYAKNGTVIPNHSMPFGGGVSMCEGRHFALGELKIFIALLLSYATIELDPESPRPRCNIQRVGVGVMHPVGDLNVHIRKRNTI